MLFLLPIFPGPMLYRCPDTIFGHLPYLFAQFHNFLVKKITWGDLGRKTHKTVENVRKSSHFAPDVQYMAISLLKSIGLIISHHSGKF